QLRHDQIPCLLLTNHGTPRPDGRTRRGMVDPGRGGLQGPHPRPVRGAGQPLLLHRTIVGRRCDRPRRHPRRARHGPVRLPPHPPGAGELRRLPAVRNPCPRYHAIARSHTYPHASWSPTGLRSRCASFAPCSTWASVRPPCTPTPTARPHTPSPPTWHCGWITTWTPRR